MSAAVPPALAVPGPITPAKFAALVAGARNAREAWGAARAAVDEAQAALASADERLAAADRALKEAVQTLLVEGFPAGWGERERRPFDPADLELGGER